MKRLKRIITAVLVLSLLFTLAVPAFAADSGKKYRNYKNYMCVGDSIAAGCGLSRDGNETYCDPNVATSDEAYEIYDPTVIYRGMGFDRAHTAYHALVQDELGCNMWQCARSGIRAVELRYMLGGGYRDFDTEYTWGNTYFDEDENGFTFSDVDAIAKRIDFYNRATKADLMTINLGSNDVFSVTLGAVTKQMTAGSAIPELAAISSFLKQGGDVGKAFGMLVDACDSLGTTAVLVLTIVDYFTRALQQFKENFDWSVNELYRINPDINIVAVGVYNPFRYFRISSGSKLDLSLLAAPIVKQINDTIASYADTMPNYYYTDVSDTETYPMNFDDPWFWEYFTLKVHPTIAGHKYMAEQILAALPEGPDSVPVLSSAIEPSTGKIRLSWDWVANADSYNVYVSTSKNGTYKYLGSTNGLSFTNSSAKPGTTYYYKIKAVSGNIEEAQFSNISYRTCDCAAPVVVGGNNPATGKIKLTWAPVQGAAKYEIWRSMSRNGTYKKYYTTTLTSFNNTSAQAGETYYYKVKAISEKTSYADSAFSNVVDRTCDCAQPVVKIGLSNGHPQLKWSKVSGAASYEIYRATSKNGTYSKYYTTSLTSFNNISAKAGTTYYYKVKAISAASSYAASAYSSVVSIKAK